MNEIPKVFWCVPAPELLRQLNTTPQGLTNQDAKQRLTQFGENRLKPQKELNTLTFLFLNLKTLLFSSSFFVAP
jgi:Mg2+-importing ATPase